jgi:hypothetical protein
VIGDIVSGRPERWIRKTERADHANLTSGVTDRIGDIAQVRGELRCMRQESGIRHVVPVQIGSNFARKPHPAVERRTSAKKGEDGSVSQLRSKLAKAILLGRVKGSSRG